MHSIVTACDDAQSEEERQEDEKENAARSRQQALVACKPPVKVHNRVEGVKKISVGRGGTRATFIEERAKNRPPKDPFVHSQRCRPSETKTIRINRACARGPAADADEPKTWW